MGKEPKEKRFEFIHSENAGLAKSVSVFRDKHTGVQYLFVSEGYAGGLSPLLDRDGKPMVDECDE